MQNQQQSSLFMYIHQTIIQQPQWLFIILVIVIMNCGDKSIKLPKIKKYKCKTCVVI